MSSQRGCPASILVALWAVGFTMMTPGNTSAGFIVTVTEVGPNLLFDYSGAFTGLATRTATDTDPSFYGYRRDFFRALDEVGDPAPGRGGTSNFAGSYSGGPASFFPGASPTTIVSTTTAAPGSSTAAFFRDSGVFQTTIGFVSGSYSASGSFTIPNRSYADLGLPQNSSNTWNWTQTGQSFVPGNTLTIVTVPEPARMTLVGGVGAAAFGVWRLRRRKTR